MYHYELDFDVADSDRVVRVAVCGQEWQPRNDPNVSRYIALWTATGHSRRPGAKFRLLKNFSWGGHFPCTLQPEPWKLKAGGG